MRYTLDSPLDPNNANRYVYAGNTDAQTSAFSYAFDPYGVPVLTSSSTGGTGVPQNPYLFAGGIHDRATGWVHFGARWYNPTTGRWTQQDTLDNPLNPKNANRYAYAGNDPINNVDPTGRALSYGCVAGAAVGSGIVGFAVQEVVEVGSSAVLAPLTGGASLIAGAALAAGLSGVIAVGVGVTAYSVGQCLA